MNWDVFVTCAVTGAGDTAGRSEHVPVTPEQIADVGDRGGPRRRGDRPPPRPRSRDRPGRPRPGALPRGRRADPRLGRRRRHQPHRRHGRRPRARRRGCPLPPDAAGTDMAGAAERLAHVAELRPEICTLDCGTMNFAAGGDYVMVNTPAMLRAMAARIRELGVRPGARGVRHRPPRLRARADRATA